MKFPSLLCLSIFLTSSLCHGSTTDPDGSKLPPANKGPGMMAPATGPANRLAPVLDWGQSKETRRTGSEKEKDLSHAKWMLSLYGSLKDHKKSASPILDNNPFIIGGIEVPAGERGYQVSIQNAGGHYCGGALIDREWVLTAAHCLLLADTSFGISVVLGSNDLFSAEALLIPVVDAFIHPDYHETNLEWDVAVLRLSQPAPESLPILKLADESVMAEYANTGDLATTSGWGALDNYNGFSPLMQQTEVPIVDQEICRSALEEAMGAEVTEHMICAGDPEGGRDSCNGDSGGPLTVSVDGEEHSIGVVSWGYYQCASPGTPGVYTRTASVRDWVIETMATTPIVRTPLDVAEGALVSAAAGEQLYFTFQLPDAVQDLEIRLTGGEGDADLFVFAGPYMLTDSPVCSSANISMDERCFQTLAPGGIYTVAVSAFTDISNVQLSVSYEPLLLTDGTVIENISFAESQGISLFLEVDESVQNLDVLLSGGTGDADLRVINLSTGEECSSTSSTSDEQCTLENLAYGPYLIIIRAFTAFEGVTLEIRFDDTPSFFPMAICQHKVVTQFGKYFIATIDIFNVSDQYLEDWNVSWEYSVPTEIQFMQNAIVTGTLPYQAESPELGRALAPGASTSIYFMVKSPLGIAENPEVTGNYCY